MSGDTFLMSLILEQTSPIDYLTRFIVSEPAVFEKAFLFSSPAEDFVSTGVAAHDQFASTLDGDPVVKTFNNFTINAGHTVTTTNRCKGLYLNILGDLVVNGTLSMTARGAKAAGRYVLINKDTKKIYYLTSLNIIDDYTNYVIISALGGRAHKNTDTSGVGFPGTGGACGGGSCGVISESLATPDVCFYSPGGNGTSFSGGAGGGSAAGATGSQKFSASLDGGAGGTAVLGSGGSRSCGGGAGNPGGSGAGGGLIGSPGTGGLMILFVRGNIIFGANGSIQSNGSAGGAASRPGGSSGGGAIHILHQGIVNTPSKITATGGSTGVTGYTAGNGSVNLVQL